MHFEGGQGRFIKRFPLLRGKGKNKSIQIRPVTVYLDQLNKLEENTVVNKEILIAEKLIDVNDAQVKVLVRGKLEKKLTVQLPVSKTAKKMIEGLGGKVEITT